MYRIAKPLILPLQMFALSNIKITFSKTRTKLAASEGTWRLPSSPIAEKKHVVFPCELKSVLIYTWIAKPFILPLQMFALSKIKITFSKTRTKLAAYEGHWRLPSSPIVRKKHVVFLCKLKSVLIYTWIAKPFILPLQMFALSNIKITFSKTRMKLAAYERHWRLPSSPIARRKHVVFLCKLKSILIYT